MNVELTQTHVKLPVAKLVKHNPLGEHGFVEQGSIIWSQVSPVYGNGQKQVNPRPLELGTHVPPLRHGDGAPGVVGHGGTIISHRVPLNNV